VSARVTVQPRLPRPSGGMRSWPPRCASSPRRATPVRPRPRSRGRPASRSRSSTGISLQARALVRVPRRGVGPLPRRHGGEVRRARRRELGSGRGQAVCRRGASASCCRTCGSRASPRPPRTEIQKVCGATSARCTTSSPTRSGGPGRRRVPADRDPDAEAGSSSRRLPRVVRRPARRCALARRLRGDRRATPPLAARPALTGLRRRARLPPAGRGGAGLYGSRRSSQNAIMPTAIATRAAWCARPQEWRARPPRGGSPIRRGRPPRTG